MSSAIKVFKLCWNLSHLRSSHGRHDCIKYHKVWVIHTSLLDYDLPAHSYKYEDYELISHQLRPNESGE